VRRRAAAPRLLVVVEGGSSRQTSTSAPPPYVSGVEHALLAVALVLIVVSYFPHSNIPVVLPTVRAERFLYFPAIGSSLLIEALFYRLHEALSGSGGAPRRWTAAITPAIFALFFGFQCVQAYRHAMD